MDFAFLYLSLGALIVQLLWVELAPELETMLSMSHTARSDEERAIMRGLLALLFVFVWPVLVAELGKRR